MMRLDEKSRNTVTLYRGDATEVKQYTMGKADPMALVGRGIYLTSSHEVAKDYTIKGSADAVVLRSGPNVDPRQFLKNTFRASMLDAEERVILQAFVDTINDEVYRFQQITSREMDALIGTGRDAHQHPRYNELMQWQNMSRTYISAYLWKHSEAILMKRLRKLFDESYVKFKKRFEDTRMMMTVLKELVVLRDDQLGQVTRFRVPKDYLSRTYRVDDPMPDWLITWIARFGHEKTGRDPNTNFTDLRYNDPEKGEIGAKNMADWLDNFRTHGMRYAWSDMNVGGVGENPSLLEFALGTHYGGAISVRPYKDDDMSFWDALTDFLMTRGYRGFHYQGGRRTGTDTFAGGSPVKHDAYSLWVDRDIQGFRVSSKPMGLKGTDPSLYQRFRFDTIVAAPLRRYFESNTRGLKYRDELANVDKIEETAQAWLQSGELEKRLDQAV